MPLLQSFALIANQSQGEPSNTLPLTYCGGVAFFSIGQCIYVSSLQCLQGEDPDSKVYLHIQYINYMIGYSSLVQVLVVEGDKINFEILEMIPQANALNMNGFDCLLVIGDHSFAVLRIIKGNVVKAHATVFANHSPIVKALWSPVSDQHFIILCKGSKVFTYQYRDNTIISEQKFNLQEEIRDENIIDIAVVKDLSCPTWNALTLYLLSENANIYSITPILPYDAIIDARISLCKVDEESLIGTWIRESTLTFSGNYALTVKPSCDNYDFQDVRVQGPYTLQGNSPTISKACNLHIVGDQIPFLFIVTFKDGLIRMYTQLEAPLPSWNFENLKECPKLLLYDEILIKNITQRIVILTDYDDMSTYYAMTQSAIFSIKVPWIVELQDAISNQRKELNLQSTQVEKLYSLETQGTIVSSLFTSDPLIDNNVKRIEMLINRQNHWTNESYIFGNEYKMLTVTKRPKFDGTGDNKDNKMDPIQYDLDKIVTIKENNKIMKDLKIKFQEMVGCINNILIRVKQNDTDMNMVFGECDRAETVMQRCNEMNKILDNYKVRFLKLYKTLSSMSHKHNQESAYGYKEICKYKQLLDEVEKSTLEIETVKNYNKKSMVEDKFISHIDTIVKKQVVALESTLERLEKLKNKV